jgi:hypothetical protein
MTGLGEGMEGERAVEMEGPRGGGMDSILSSEKPGVPEGEADGQRPVFVWGRGVCVCEEKKE